MVKPVLYLVLGAAALVAALTGQLLLPFQQRGTGSRWGNWSFGFDMDINDVKGPVTGLLMAGLLIQLNPLRWSFAGGAVDEHAGVRDFRFEFGPLAFYWRSALDVSWREFIPFL